MIITEIHSITTEVKKDCMKNLYIDLKEHAMKITNFWKTKKVTINRKKEQIFYKQEPFYICRNKFYSSTKIYWKVRDHEH